MPSIEQPAEVSDHSFSGIKVYKSNPDVPPIVRAERYADRKLSQLAAMIGERAYDYFQRADLVKILIKK